MRPSTLLAMISGLLMFVATILVVYELYYKKTPINNIILAALVTGLAIAYGIHGLSHFFEEYYYDFNPFAGKWAMNDVPVR